MKKISKVLIGLSAATATFIPTTIALTSCGNGWISSVGSKKRTLPVSGSTIKVSFLLKTSDYQKPLSASFVYDSDKQEWFKLIGGPYYEGTNNSVLYFSFCRNPKYYGSDFPEVKGHFEFRFNNKSKGIVNEIKMNGYTFNIQK